MECQTVSHLDRDVEILKDKKKFKSKGEADNEAKKLNKQEGQIYKVVSYKCGECGFYHLGGSDSAIPRK